MLGSPTAPAPADRVQGSGEEGRPGGPTHYADRQHGRHHDDAPERQPAVMGPGQGDGPAHRVREGKMRMRHQGMQDGILDRLQVETVIVEIRDVAPMRIVDLSLRLALATPVEGDDGEAPPAQVGDGLVVLLDEFGPALEEADGSLHQAGGRAPMGGAQLDAVVGAHRLEGTARRNGIVGGGAQSQHRRSLR